MSSCRFVSVEKISFKKKGLSYRHLKMNLTGFLHIRQNKLGFMFPSNGSFAVNEQQN